MITRFRAWDVIFKSMRGVDYIDYVEKCVGFRLSDPDGDTYIQGLRNIKLMQSTGLVDKNGVEIFEGDVVKLFDKDLYVVEWSSQEASYKLIPVDKRWSDCYFSNYENITKIIEVVGNIWEDGELLDS